MKHSVYVVQLIKCPKEVCTRYSPHLCWHRIPDCLAYQIYHNVCLWILFHGKHIQYVQSNDNSGFDV